MQCRIQFGVCLSNRGIYFRPASLAKKGVVTKTQILISEFVFKNFLGKKLISKIISGHQLVLEEYLTA
jgi:hypothetical protein